ncbi:MAG TPA: biliverdin-producing heme oxygenase [Actinocrinis sp.]|nr:biliverdin-producing heme oxygenase [Actinocrinis sp.]
MSVTSEYQLTDGWRPPDRAAHLRSDLAAIGWSARRMGDVSLCSAEELPVTGSLPRAIGALYVIEGAALGGQLIARILVDLLALPPSMMRYVTNDAVLPRRELRRFTQNADRCAQTASDIDAPVESALATFDLFKRQMEAHVPVPTSPSL